MIIERAKNYKHLRNELSPSICMFLNTFEEKIHFA